jgi:hypothetical protein
MTRGLGGESPANVSAHLKGIDFPAQRDDLLDHAERNGAPREVVDVIGRMPDGKFESMADVMKAYGEAESGDGLSDDEEDDVS